MFLFFFFSFWELTCPKKGSQRTLKKKIMVDIMKHSKQSGRPGFSRMQQKHAVGGGLSLMNQKRWG